MGKEPAYFHHGNLDYESPAVPFAPGRICYPGVCLKTCQNHSPSHSSRTLLHTRQDPYRLTPHTPCSNRYRWPAENIRPRRHWRTLRPRLLRSQSCSFRKEETSATRRIWRHHWATQTPRWGRICHHPGKMMEQVKLVM